MICHHNRTTERVRLRHSFAIMRDLELNDYDYAKGDETGIPEAVLRLADSIFKGLPASEAKKFALKWPRAIREGANLNLFKSRFCAFILREQIARVLLLKMDGKLKGQVVKAIRGVLGLHEKLIKTGRSAAWGAAWGAAGSAAWSAGESAAWSAESAAWSAAESAAWGAGSAVWSAAESAESAAWNAARSAESAAWKRYAAEFVRLCRESS